MNYSHPLRFIAMKTYLKIIAGCLLWGEATEATSQTPIYQQKDATGTPTFIEFEIPSNRSEQINMATLQNDTLTLKTYLPVNNRHTFKEVQQPNDPLGYTHRKYQQYFRGIMVENNVYTVHSKNGNLSAMNGNFTPIEENNSITPTITETEALNQAIQQSPASIYMWNTSSANLYYQKKGSNYLPTGKLLFINMGGAAKLVYKFDIFSLVPLRREYVFIDAKNGQLLKKTPILMDCFPTTTTQHTSTHSREDILKNSTNTSTINGNFSTRYIGSTTSITDLDNNTYRLRDYSRGKGIETLNVSTLNNSDLDYNLNNAVDFIDNDNIWTEYNNSKKDNAALDVHKSTQNVYDFFKNTFSRNSIDDNNLKLRSYVHFLGIEGKYVNAFWTGNEMFYGDGDGTRFDPLTSQDVIAHELGHGICQFTANLQYEGESGALNEALSDIWGAVVENKYYATKKTWLIGEDFDLISKTGFRDMSNPRSRNMPQTYFGNNWVWQSNFDNGGVHINSSVINYWFYLLSQGGNGTNDFGVSFNVTGLGISDASKIVYRTETLYLAANSGFLDFRAGVITATKDIFGANSIQMQNVMNSFAAVGITSPLLPAQQNFYPTACSVPQYQKTCGIAMTADIIYTSTLYSAFSIICNSSSPLFLDNCNFKFLSDLYVGNIMVAPKGSLIVEAGNVIKFESQVRENGFIAGLNVPYGSTFKAQICSSSTNTQAYAKENISTQNIATEELNTEKNKLNMVISPNPIINDFIINFTLPIYSQINVFITSSSGQTIISVLENETKEAGSYQIPINATNLTAGVYFVILQANEKRLTKKIMVVK